MDEDIDYKTLYEKVSDELTQARIAILDLRRKQGMNFSFNAVSGWVTRNYLLIVVGVMLGSFVISMFRMFFDMLSSSNEGDNGSRLSE